VNRLKNKGGVIINKNTSSVKQQNLPPQAWGGIKGEVEPNNNAIMT
jgi:hypothetical protein